MSKDIMLRGDLVNRILIVTNSEKNKEAIENILKDLNGNNITSANNSNEASRKLIENSFDIIIINTPLKDEFGSNLAINAIKSNLCGVILIVKNEMLDEISQNLEEYGIFVIGKPISKIMFLQTIKLIKASQNRILNLKNENDVLKNKIQEIKIVDRAKCILIQHLNMSESQAHRYIEKQSMDKRISKKELAQTILKEYECSIR